MSYRTCTKCQACKPTERFYYIKRSQSYDTRCKDCVLAYINERRATIPGVLEREKASQGKSYKTRKAKDPNLGTWATKTDKQKRKMVGYVRAWRARNHGAFNEEQRQSIQMRRSLAFGKAWPLIVHHYGGKCLGCGATSRLCFDHVKPKAMGGDNLLTNGQPLCLRCNTFKGATVRDKDHRPDQGAWIGELGRLNPWLVEPMPRGAWHKKVGGPQRLARMKELASGELVMPGHIAQSVGQGTGVEEGGNEGKNEGMSEGMDKGMKWVPTVCAEPERLSTVQNAQKRLLDHLIANLPIE